MEESQELEKLPRVVTSVLKVILSFSLNNPLELLKSGIPLSQLQPAPPKKTILLLFCISSFN